MNAETTVTISAAIVACVQLSKWAGLPDSWGPVAVLGLSLLGVLFWGWSSGDITRATAFNYFAGWISVALSAAGTFGFTRAGAGAVSRMSGPPASGAGSSPTT